MIAAAQLHDRHNQTKKKEYSVTTMRNAANKNQHLAQGSWYAKSLSIKI